MEKNKLHIQSELERYDDLYWKSFDKLHEKQDKLMSLQNEVINLKTEVEEYNNKRIYFQELFDEIIENQKLN
jgi:hypothetical protein